MYTKILHATDLSEPHFAISQKAATIAKYFGAELHLMHVVDLPPTTLQVAQGLGFAEFDCPVMEDAEAVMRVLGEALNVSIARQYVEIGKVKLCLFNKIKAIGCELIIIGKQTPHALPTLLGSIAYAIVNHAQCDVLTLEP